MTDMEETHRQVIDENLTDLAGLGWSDAHDCINESVLASCRDRIFSAVDALVEAARLSTALTLPRKTAAAIRADEREHLMSLALGSEADEYRAYDGHVAEWLRSQTQGKE